jgi:hypothetical protein
MALVLANRVQETTTTTGTGTVTLAGAVAGFQSFAVIGNANTTYYTITSGNNWEVGIGTYTSSGTTLARTTILSSSNGGSAITLAGTSTVFVTYPSEKSISDGYGLLPVPNGGTGAATLTSGYLIKGNGTSAASASVVYDNGTNVGIGTSSPTELLTLDGGVFAINRYAASGAINMQRADGTQSSPTAIAAATNVSLFNFRGYDGAAYRTVAHITASAEAAITPTSSPGNLFFRTTPSGSVTPLTRMRILSSGNVGIGTDAPTSLLHVAGALTLDTALSVTNGGTGAATLTGVVIGNGTSALTTVTAPSGAIVGTTDTQTLTDKRVTPRVNAQTTTASPFAWNSDSYDQQSFSALANALTINADAGTPTDGQRAIFRFEDNGTARALTWTTGATKAFRAVGVTLPTTTVVGKVTYVGCIYNVADLRWDAVAVSQEA